MAYDPPPGWRERLGAFAAHTRGVAGLAPATVANHHTYLGAFARWWDATRPDQPVTGADAATIAAFLAAEGQRGVAARTRQAQLAALRRFFAWLQLCGEIAANPAAVVETPRAAPLAPQTYSPDQVAAILAHTAGLGDLRGRQRHAIVATLRYTGMRSQELRTLARDDLDLAGGRAWVTGKAGRRRPVLIPDPLVGVLTAFCEQVRPQLPDSPLVLANAHPFVTTPHAGFSQEALAREVELAGQGARVPGRHHPHLWRHTYATELVRAGVDVHVVQRLLGHANIASTVAYTHLALDDLQATVAGVWS